MDFSSHHESGGTLHLPSPTHPHSPRLDLDSFASLKQLRRSLSRSPSKPSRFQFRKSPTKSPNNSPLSPLALSRAFSPRPLSVVEPSAAFSPQSPFLEQPPVTTVKRAKFPLRRTGNFIRSSPRTRSSPKSPKRRVFGESIDTGNVTPSASRRSSGEENSTTPPGEPHVPEVEQVTSKPSPSPFRFELNDGPIRFDFPELMKPATDHNSLATTFNQPPVKSSPLKRSDGVMNLDRSNTGSPVAKRRSLHGASLTADFNVFDMAPPTPPVPATMDQPQNHDQDREMANSPFSSPAPRRTSPPRKISLRTSTLRQRHSQTPARVRPGVEPTHQPEFAVPNLPFWKRQNRMSLDSAQATSDQIAQSPMRPPISTIETFPVGPMPHRPSPAHQNRHPLANIQSIFSPSPAASQIAPQNKPMMPPPTPGPVTRAPRPLLHKHPNTFAHSLPVGSSRPAADLTFATPAGFKSAKPLPAAFMSTGLISKKNRDASPTGPGSNAYAMPDTPSKRNSFPPASPKIDRRATVSKPAFPRLEFGTPNSPYSTYPGASSPEVFGKSANFGKGANLFAAGRFKVDGPVRRGSFIVTEEDENAESPSKQMESQSSDEMPPTPTKPAGASGRHSKENSLRSSLFGRRTSLGPETFVPPAAIDVSSPKQTRTVTPSGHHEPSGRSSPHTPSEKFKVPDPSGLFISATKGDSRGLFNSSLASFPPATPTGSREQSLFGKSSIVSVTQNDVDTALTARFGTVVPYGGGEFSQVYRVERPLNNSLFSQSTPVSAGRIWAVKKSKRPFQGNRDRDNQLMEAQVLKALRGNDHVINYIDHWEAGHRLYIQTEFCENGNLKDFLTQAGYKARLDDFRIWKVLLEIALGVKFIHDSGFIHLDLKPANVFIDWEGVLKIGDFGLASPWPVPKGHEGEGDREYIGPEILNGRFDKPADIFAMGMIMVEIAGNIMLPDNGLVWQRFRAGNLSDVPSLTWSTDSSLVRNESGDPVVPTVSHNALVGEEDDSFTPTHKLSGRAQRRSELMTPPAFMEDPNHEESLDKVVQWMVNPDPDVRPTINQLYHCGGVQWVERRRRAGATIFEGNWGPSDEILNYGQHHGGDVTMTDV